MLRIALVLLITVLLPSTAFADWSARVVARAPGETVFSAEPIQARVGERVELRFVLLDERGRVHGDVSRVALGSRAREPRGPLPDIASIRWLSVEPRLRHVTHEPPNPGNPSFSNSVLFGADHGDWLGFDTLEYEESDVARVGPQINVERASPVQGRVDYAGAGSNWFAVEVTLADGSVARSPGAESVERGGLSGEVMRVSFRESDTFLGWLSTYFNVPNVFGSAGSGSRHQTDRYTGADCADVLVGALRAAGEDVAYTSVAGIGRLAEPVGDAFVIGLDGRTLGLDLQLGDLRERRTDVGPRALNSPASCRVRPPGVAA